MKMRIKNLRLSTLAVATVTIALCQAAMAEPWEDPQVNEINRLPARTFVPPEAQFVQSLNGLWKFNWVGAPSQRPLDFWKTDFNDSEWQTIDVPSCVEMRGYGVPIYLAHGYPHPYTPPTIDPAYNPVLSYRRSFEVPKEWNNRRILLRFNGVYSGYYVWVNGKKVGYAEDSKLPSMFDITEFVQDGRNILCVQVFRWCDGSYFEDQDMIRFSGIFRDVSLIAEPKHAIGDFVVTTKRDERGSKRSEGAPLTEVWTLDVRTDDKDVKATLYDTAQAQGEDALPTAVAMATVDGQLTVTNAHCWSPEDPYLYTLVLENGDDIRTCRVGFREVKLVGSKLLLNGRALKIKGVNRHEHSAANGRSVSLEEMLADITLMKRANINTVRTSHYPNDPRWYDLCDKYGIMLIAEANVEAHGARHYVKKVMSGLGCDPIWRKTIVERNLNQVKTYRNHPSIIMWSLGNENGGGESFDVARDAVKTLDPTRPVHYEGNCLSSDIDSRMYPPVPWLVERGKFGDGKAFDEQTLYNTYNKRRDCLTVDKPFIMCEYAHSMGNALGNFQEYWDAVYTYDCLLGGCIWDWVDQTIWKDTDRIGPDGKRIRYLAYGGDFDGLGVPNDESFAGGPVCVNGVIRPDREVTAKLVEVAHVYRNLVTRGDPLHEKVTLENRFLFTPSDAFAGSWRILADGVEVASGALDVPSVKPGATAPIALPLPPEFVPEQGKEYFYEVSFALKADTLWAKAGHIIARDQLPFIGEAAKLPPTKADTKATVETNGDEITVVAGKTKATFSRKTGTLSSLAMNGVKVLADEDGVVHGPRLTCVRAFTDNDAALRPSCDIRKPFFASGLSQLRYHPAPIKVEGAGRGRPAHNGERGEGVRVTTKVTVNGAKSSGWTHTTVWTFGEDGSLTMENSVTPFGKFPALTRLGLTWKIDGALDKVAYYGRGPRENYIDRNTGSFLGRYETTVDGLAEKYVRPQDNGMRTDVRWISFANADGRGIRFAADRPFFAQAMHFDWEDLEFARHHSRQQRIYAPPMPRKETVVNIDIRQRGLGGASCGPMTLDKYCFPVKPEQWTVRLEPLTSSAN